MLRERRKVSEEVMFRGQFDFREQPLFLSDNKLKQVLVELVEPLPLLSAINQLLLDQQLVLDGYALSN